MVKFRFSEKARKIWKNFQLFLTLLSKHQWYIRDIQTSKIFVVYFFNEIFFMILWNTFIFLRCRLKSFIEGTADCLEQFTIFLIKQKRKKIVNELITKLVVDFPNFVTFSWYLNLKCPNAWYETSIRRGFYSIQNEAIAVCVPVKI